LLMPTSM